MILKKLVFLILTEYTISDLPRLRPRQFNFWTNGDNDLVTQVVVDLVIQTEHYSVYQMQQEDTCFITSVQTSVQGNPASNGP